MRKYRVKNDDGRILGPFSLSQLEELNQKDQIYETSLFQVFPIGDWEKASDLKEINKIFHSKPAQKVPEKPLENNVSQKVPNQIDPDSTAFREFKFDRNEEELVDYSQLKKEYGKPEEEEVAEDDGFEKTVVVNRKSLGQEIDKTVVVSRNDLEELEEGADVLDDLDGSGTEAKKEEKVVEPKVEEPKISADDKTMIASVKDLQVPVVANVEDDVAEIESKLRSFELEGSVEQKRRSKKKPKKEKKGESAPLKSKKNLSMALFLVVAIIFLLPEEEEQKVEKVLRPKIIFPVAEANRSPKEAEEKRKQGLKEMLKGDYISTIKATGHFKRSLELQFKQNRSLSYLIYSYSKLLPETGRNLIAGRTLFRLINIQRPKILSDSYMALGTAGFYSHYKKHDTAIYVIENHLRLNKPTPLLFAAYLDELLEVGNFVQAEKIFDKLKSAKTKRFEVVRSLVNYYVANENLDEAIKLAKKNHEKFVKNYKFLTLYGNLLLKNQDYKTLAKVTKYLIENKGGGSPFVYSEALKFMGYIAIYKGKTEEVAKYFNASLKYYNSDELKQVLAALEVEGTDLTKEIITKSKIDVLIKNSKKEAKDLRWDEAFQLAVQASDLDESNLDSQLYLASIQSQRGYLNAAISTLEKLREKYPTNINVNYELIMANIRAYKKTEAKRLIAMMSTNAKFKSSFEYLAILGHYYALAGNDKLSFERFKGALQKNPLRDDIYYEMSLVAFKNNKFKKCKQFLNEAQQLDPRNIDYKILYSKVLFEEDGLETAVGYLRSQLEKFKDNPKILGQIAVLYYRDQSYSEYKEYKERLERLKTKDESLYEFLVETSELEKNNKTLIQSAEKLVIIAPGNLEVRMKLANALTEEKQFQKAIDQLNEVEERLSSYPRVNFFKARIYILNKDYKKAEVAAKKETKLNPESEYGYYILGETYLKLKKFPQAKKNLEKSIQLKPDFYECLLSLGWLKFKQGYYPAARELYQRALRQRPSDPEIHKRLGYVYKEIGQSAMAAEEFRTYLNLNPVAPDQNIIKRLIRQLQ